MSTLSRTDQLRTLFPQIFYRSPVPAALTHVESGAYIEVNDAWVELFGFARDEAVGKTRKELNIWADAEQQQIFSALVRGQGIVSHFEVSGRKKSGEMAHVLLSCEILEYHGERSVLTVLHDISERKRAELLLRESEERFAMIFSHSPLAMSVARMGDGVMSQINRAYEKLTGYENEELAGRSAIDAGLWVEPAAHARLLSQLKGGTINASIETQLRKKDGSLIDLMFTAALIRVGDIELLLSTLIDMSDVRRIARQKAETEARFEKMVESSPVATTLTRLDSGVYLGVNRAFEALLGYPREEVLGKSSIDLGIWTDANARDHLWLPRVH